MALTPPPASAGKISSQPLPSTRATKQATKERTPPPDRLLTELEVAGHLGISLQTLAKWRREGMGPTGIRLSRNVTRYNMADVDAYVEKFRATSETSS